MAAARVRFSALGRELTIRTQGLTGPEIKRELATRARRERDRTIEQHRALTGINPEVEVAVNGRRGASEESVVLPGPIVYTFRHGNEIATYLVAFLQKRSPKKTGLYARRHRIIVNGSWPNKVGTAKSFTVVNTEPFSRKLEVGAMKARVPPHIYEDARQAAQGRYGRLATFSLRYIELAGGYILKGHGRGRRRDTRAGEPMRYPSILVQLR